MRCKNRVIWEQRRAKGSGKPYIKATQVFPTDVPPELVPAAAVECGGKITADIEAVDEPNWGGSYAVLEIRYNCDNCHGGHYPDLPRTPEELSRFVTDAIENK